MNQLATIDGDVQALGAPEATAEPSGLGCLAIIARHHGLDLSVSQLAEQRQRNTRELSVTELLKVAKSVGLQARSMRPDWKGLIALSKALPVLITLKNGRSMVLVRLELDNEPMRVVLEDPNAGDDALLIIDRTRFESAWSGDVVLVRRNYDMRDEAQPFSISFVRALIFRERRIVRDIAVCAVVLGFLSLLPIMFWQVLTVRVLGYKALSTFYFVVVAMISVIALDAVFRWIRQFLIIHLTARVDVKLNTYIFDKLIGLPIDFFERNQIGGIMTVYYYHQRILSFLTGQLLGSLLDSTVLMFFLPVMFFLSPLVTTFILVICAIIVAWLIFTLPIYRRKGKWLEALQSERGSFLYQTLAGIRTVKALTLEPRQRHRFDALTHKVAKSRIEHDMFGAVVSTVVRPLEMTAIAGGLAVAVYICMTTQDPTLTAALFAFLLLSQRVISPLIQIAMSLNQWDDARIAIEAIGDLVNRPEEEGRSREGPRPTVHGKIEFQNVTFTYRDAGAPALRDISFAVPAGTTLGLVGRSGSGKTTVTRLLQRLSPNYQGQILIDGVELRDYDLEYLRRCLGVVLQDNFLFSGTIRDNIASGKPDASLDEVRRAARLAGAEEFIDRLPRGYDTFINEGSSNISGGQRQRLAIARALILDPRILILDEATSALDPESEAIVNSNLARIAHGRSLIVVSHRLSSLVKSDAIMVLERGGLEDVGTHQELLGRCEIYRHLWDQQNRHISAPTGAGRPPPSRTPSLVS
ncbi:MAG: peptidase domain-containing ABC transporter [Xanthobacteraceae bacterium]|nr:peptidase domain-containing ABC transporter [Xanthobacteraceae bacterium]MBV9630363.1 peptidase domain-containing ABC transporter [Xanthobacteraceae bacterium]